MREPSSLPPGETWSGPLTSLTTMISMGGESSLLKTKTRRVAGVEGPEAGPGLDQGGQEGQDLRDPDLSQDQGPREGTRIQNQDPGPSQGIDPGQEDVVLSLDQDPSQGTEVDPSPDPDLGLGKIQSPDQDPRKDPNQGQTLKRGPSLDLSPPRGLDQDLSLLREKGQDLDQNQPRKKGQDQDQNPPRENDQGPDQSLSRERGLGQDLNQPRKTDPGQNLVPKRGPDPDPPQTEGTRDPDPEVLSKETRKQEKNLLHRMVTTPGPDPDLNLQKVETRLTLELMTNMQPHLRRKHFLHFVKSFHKIF